MAATCLLRGERALDRILEVSIRSAGDFTRELHEELQPGTPAKATGPFGGFDYRRGGQEQIWIAGGIGVTPFMSWIRSMDVSFDCNVAFYYSVAQESDALYLGRIQGCSPRAFVVLTPTSSTPIGTVSSRPRRPWPASPAMRKFGSICAARRR